MEIIAKIQTDFPTKFGIPRQSGLVESLKGVITFEPKYRNPQGVYGLDGYSYIWLLWSFSENHREGWSATVKPPRLGGNKRMGVFATRSPFRPNDICLSCVKLERVVLDEKNGPMLYVAGVDLMDQTPIYDIKPYIPFTDSHPDAKGGFSDAVKDYELEVSFPAHLLAHFPEEKREAVIYVLKQDPRPAYQRDETRRYGVDFAGFDVRFHVKGQVLTVCELEERASGMIFR